MNELPESVNVAKPGPNPASSHFWRYFLVALISILLTFALTVSGGLFLYFTIGSAQTLTRTTEPGSAVTLDRTFSDDADTKAALDKLEDVYDKVDKNFYKDLTDAEMLEAMTRGLVDELGNRYTMYLTAEEVTEMNEAMSGNYVGIGGIVAFNASQQVELTEVVAGSPAESAGLQIGDVFMKVNGEDVSRVKDISEVVVLVRGEEGTSVELEIYRPATRQTINVTAVRRRITTASVSHKMLQPGIGYVRVSEFSKGVADLFATAVDDLQSQGARHLVVDLRNNGGGLANEVTAMLDYLLPQTTLATLEGRSEGKPFSEAWTSDRQMGVPDSMRYAILINDFTASASELFSGCLRDHDKAWLIGEQSFGKGSGTLTFDLADGSAINVTNFLYYLPDGESIEGVGLKPDQIIGLPESVAGKSITQLTLEEDTQLSAAIQYLTKLPSAP